MKRSLRNFGNQLGLTIYDREHIKVLKKNARMTRSNNPTPKAPKPVNPHFETSSASKPNSFNNGNVQIISEPSSQNVMNNNQTVNSTTPKTPLIPTTTTTSPLIPTKSPSFIPVKMEPKSSPPLIPVNNGNKSSVPLIPVGKRMTNSQNLNDPKKRKIE